MYSRLVVLKVKSLDHQHKYHLGAVTNACPMPVPEPTESETWGGESPQSVV